MAVRKDGILLVDDTGETIPGGVEGNVAITYPLGSQPSSSSVSVVIAGDQLPLPVDISGAGAVDVQITNIPLPISGTVAISNSISILDPVSIVATDLDIRNLAFATDKVDVSNSIISASITNAVLTVTAINLDIRNLTFAQDKIDASGSLISVSGSTVNLSGPVEVANLVSVTATDLDIRQLAFDTDKIDVSGSVISVNNINTVATATITSILGSITSIQLLAAKAIRKGYKLFNDSDSVAYVKEGATASLTSFSYKIQPDWLYESVGVGVYTGKIDCIWANSTSGSMRVTELE